jgi:predicted nucleic acid-binding Zn ribbon protein
MENTKEIKKANKKADIVLFVIIAILALLVILGVRAIWV